MFAREAEFAMQALRRNEFTGQVARQNPMSLRDAIVQAAAAGVTLNPATGHGYLVPRGGAIYFEPSYRGLRDAAVEDGLIRWARAEIVHERDSFTVTENDDGSRIAVHAFEPFGDRGKILGGFCAWETGTGFRDLIFETLDELHASHRSRSDAWKSSKGPGGIWKTDEAEAIRKALVKRAQKSWPRGTGRAGRLEAALAAEFAGDTIETTAEPHVERVRIVRPSETPHAGKAGPLVAEPADEPDFDAPMGEEATLAVAIEERRATVAAGDMDQVPALERVARKDCGLPESGDLDAAQLRTLHAYVMRGAGE